MNRGCGLLLSGDKESEVLAARGGFFVVKVDPVKRPLPSLTKTIKK